MSTRKTSVAIDEELLSSAQKVLGTATLRETIEGALLQVLRAQARLEEIEALKEMKGLDLADPDVMPRAWRP